MAYRTRLPRRGKSYGRPSLLYQAWINLKGRTRGHSTKSVEMYKGLPLGFANFQEFREFALKNGFSKQTPSPDRIIEHLGYVPGNIRFTKVLDNVSAALHRYNSRGAQPPGPEPPSYYGEESNVHRPEPLDPDDVPF